MRKEITYTIEGYEIEEILGAKANYDHHTVTPWKMGTPAVLGATVRDYRKSDGTVIDLKTARATVIQTLRNNGVLSKDRVTSEIKASHSWGVEDDDGNRGSVYYHRMIIRLSLNVGTKTSEEGNLVTKGNLEIMIKLINAFDSKAEEILQERTDLLHPHEELTPSSRDLAGFNYDSNTVYVSAYGHDPDDDYMKFPVECLFEPNWKDQVIKEIELRNQTEEQKRETLEKESRRKLYIELKEEFE